MFRVLSGGRFRLRQYDGLYASNHGYQQDGPTKKGSLLLSVSRMIDSKWSATFCFCAGTVAPVLAYTLQEQTSTHVDFAGLESTAQCLDQTFCDLDAGHSAEMRNACFEESRRSMSRPQDISLHS